MPVKDLVEFILYVIPGYLAVRLYRSVYLVSKTSDFHQTAWSIIVGLPLVALVKWMDATYFHHALHSDKAGVPHLFFWLVLYGLGILTGGIFVAQHAWRCSLVEKHQWLGLLRACPQTVWAELNRASNQDWVAVFLDNGAIYGGWVKTYRFNPDAEGQDFLLTRAKRLDERRDDEGKLRLSSA